MPNIFSISYQSMFRINFLIILLLLLFMQLSKAQAGLTVGQEPWRINELNQKTNEELINIKSVAREFVVTESKAIRISVSPTPLKSFDIGWFCRLDANMDLKLPYKLRFRLGEYHYTRRLEYGEEY